MPPLMVAVHFGRALVRRAELELLHETSSTATRHHLPNGLDVTSPGELRAGARSVVPGPGVVPGCAEAREGVGLVPPCRSWALMCENVCV